MVILHPPDSTLRGKSVRCLSASLLLKIDRQWHSGTAFLQSNSATSRFHFASHYSPSSDWHFLVNGSPSAHFVILKARHHKAKQKFLWALTKVQLQVSEKPQFLKHVILIILNTSSLSKTHCVLLLKYIQVNLQVFARDSLLCHY